MPAADVRLDGVWRVERTGGLLPPLHGVSKHIDGDHGQTRIGRRVGIPFRVEGLNLRYCRPLSGFVDVLEPDGQGFRGRACFFGREFGLFVLHRITPDGNPDLVGDLRR
jgi:hypothetical protein